MKNNRWNNDNRYNIKIIDDISINTVKKESNLKKVVKEVGKLLIKKEISKFYLDKIGKVIKNWNEYKLDRKINIKEVRQI